MILFIEPISKNTGMYVPAYPLPIMEIASFVKFNIPQVEIEIISIPVDYGLPLTQEGKKQIYKEVLKDLSEIKPSGVGISCTAIAQAEEVIHLCELIKEFDPNIFIFLGGYFPTIYYEEILFRTSSVNLIVIGEGEISALKIIELLE
ncbi:cobalamin-dependent protein, partial [bacterium]|nr:cobalamin-dependent protein [bacterium]